MKYYLAPDLALHSAPYSVPVSGQMPQRNIARWIIARPPPATEQLLLDDFPLDYCLPENYLLDDCPRIIASR